jgi:CDP-diacylglycerol--serine O-phosphatidyltransferase
VSGPPTRVGRRALEPSQPDLAIHAQTALSWPDVGTTIDVPARRSALGGDVPTRDAGSTDDTADVARRLAEEAPQTVPLLTGPITAARRRRFALVNACTLASLISGMFAIFLAMNGDVRIAAAALLACVAFDGLDGALARKLGVSTPFGAQMDSLADMCSFGIATPVVAFAWLAGPAPIFVIAPVCALVAICAAIRLARFNVSPKNGRFFSGVPTTIAAAIIVVTVLLRPEPGRWLSALLVAGLAIAMVSTFPYFKLGALRRVPIWVWPVAIVAAVVDPSTTLGIGVGAYLLSGPLLWARQRRAVASV